MARPVCASMYRLYCQGRMLRISVMDHHSGQRHAGVRLDRHKQTQRGNEQADTYRYS